MTLALLAVLLLISGFFSGSETAFFSIDRVGRQRLRSDAGLAAKLVLQLLERPRELLVAILFGNVLTNIFYFSVSANMAVALRAEQPKLEPLVHVGALLAIIVFGEIVPKSATIAAPVSVARFFARPLSLWSRLSRFVTEPLGWATGRGLGLLERRIGGRGGGLTDVELARLVALEGEEGVIRPAISTILEDVLLLKQVRVREVMTPRVDIISFDLEAGRAAFVELVGRCRRGKIPVHRGEGVDGIFGVLHVKRVLAAPGAALDDLVERAWFIPETKRVDAQLQDMLRRDATLAIVVDEYGGTAGIVTVDDVVEEIVGEISLQDAPPPIRRTGPDSFLLSGTLSLREVNDLLETSLDDEGATTLAGFITRKLERIPRQGDLVEIDQGFMRVAEVEKLRTRTVEVRLAERRGAEEGSE